MSFRTEAGNVRRGLDKGIYKKPSKDFEGFADALNAGLVRADQAKLQEDLVIRREKRDEARAVRAKAAAAEKVQASQQKLATLFMNSQPQEVRDSPVARSQIMTLIVDGGIKNLNALKKYVAESSNFAPRTTEMRPVGSLQGPNMPVDPKISDMGLGFGADSIQTGSNLDSGGTQSQTDKPLRVSDLSKIAEDPKYARNSNYASQAQEMIDILAERGTPLDGTTGGAGDFSENPTQEVVTEGQYNFGPQPIKLTAADIKEDNWLSLLYMADKDANIESIELIEGIANANGWVNIMGQSTKEELIGMELEQVVEELKLYAGSLSEEAKTTVDAIIEVKEATKANANWWATTEGLLEKETNFLTIATGVYPTGSVALKNITEHLRKRIPMETVLASGEIDLSGILKEDAAFYDAWLLTATGDKFNTPEGAVKVQQVMRLRSAALEMERLDGLADEKALSIKDQALNAWYAENGYFNINGDPKQPIKKPSSGEMAKFENMWTTATTAAKDLDIWESVDKIKSLDVDTLKMIVNAKLLPENSSQMQEAKNALSERTTQEADAASAELRDFTGENFSTTEQMDVWLASRGGADKLFADDAQKEAWIATKAILFGNELAANNEAKAKEFSTSYAAAFSKFINNAETQKLKGDKFQKAMAEFERNWKDSASATPVTTPKEVVYDDNTITRLIVEANQNIKSGNPDLIYKGRQFIDVNLPLIISARITTANITEEAAVALLMEASPGLSRNDAIKIINGVITLGVDPISKTPISIDMTDLSEQSDLKPTDPGVQTATSIINDQLAAKNAGMELTAKEIAASNSLLALGHESLIKELGFDPSDAMGGSGFFGNIANSAASLVGWTPFKDVAAGKDYMNALNNSAARVLSVLIEGSRDSVFKQKEIYKTLPLSGQFLTTDLQGMITVRRVIADMEEEITRLGQLSSRDNQSTNPTQKADAYAMAMQLGIIYRGYKAVDNAWAKSEEKFDMTKFNLTDTVSNNPPPAKTGSLTQSGTSVDGIPIFSFGGNN